MKSGSAGAYSRSVIPMTVVFCLFALTIGAAWGWFHVNPRQYATRLKFGVRRDVASYQFTNLVLSEGVLDELAISTNDLVNGIYNRVPPATPGVPERITVFYAGWAARSAREMSVVQHTPDICWVGAGAVPIALGQPSSVLLDLSGTPVPFECRVFLFQDGAREMSLWCTLVSGQVYGEGLRFSPEKSPIDATSNAQDPIAARYAAGRRVGGNQFLNAVRQRIAGTGEKQFVRLSTPVYRDDWTEALDRLRTFANSWLLLQVSGREEAVAIDPPLSPTIKSFADR